MPSWLMAVTSPFVITGRFGCEGSQSGTESRISRATFPNQVPGMRSLPYRSLSTSNRISQEWPDITRLE